MSYTSLVSRRTHILSFTPKPDVTGFFLQDLARFLSIAGTLKASAGVVNLGLSASIDDRNFTHPLLRTLLETYFLNLWLFDNLTQAPTKYASVLGKFAAQYQTFWNELNADPAYAAYMAGPGSVLPPASTLAVATGPLLDVKSMLAAVTRSNGTRATDLYLLYRISSFDIHGRALAITIETAFARTGLHFPILDVSTAIDQMAVDYDLILDDLIAAGMI